MRLITLIFCTVTLLGCEPDQPGGEPIPARRSVGVPASGSVAPWKKQPERAERPERAPLPKVLRTAQPAASAAATGTATATASAAAALPQGTLGTLTRTTSVKVTRLTAAGESHEGRIVDRGMIRPLLDAIGLTQTTADGCGPCMPSLTFTFQDGYGTRLATLGTFCTAAGVGPETATLSDPLGNQCETVTLSSPKVLEAQAKRVLAEAATRPARPAR